MANEKFSNSTSSDELRFKEILDLPNEKRAGVGREFTAIVGRLLKSFQPYVNRLASPMVRPHEVQDVTAGVIAAAYTRLLRQFLESKGRRGDWKYHNDQFETWFRFFCGSPGGEHYGEINNQIRNIWRSYRSDSVDIDGENDKEDEESPNPEEALIEAEQERQKAGDLLNLATDLEEIEPRQAFMARLSFGVHNYPQLDPQALVSLAEKLGFTREPLALVRAVAPELKLSPQQTELTQKQIARLTGVHVNTVRKELKETKRILQASIVRQRADPATAPL